MPPQQALRDAAVPTWPPGARRGGTGSLPPQPHCPCPLLCLLLGFSLCLLRATPKLQKCSSLCPLQETSKQRTAPEGHLCLCRKDRPGTRPAASGNCAALTAPSSLIGQTEKALCGAPMSPPCPSHGRSVPDASSKHNHRVLSAPKLPAASAPGAARFQD